MEAKAETKQVRVSPRKVRLVADAIRNQKAVNALEALALAEKRGAYVLAKTLKSAIANALQKGEVTQESLIIKSIEVTDGPAFKRFHPSTRGRVHPYKKRTSHIRVTVTAKI